MNKTITLALLGLVLNFSSQAQDIIYLKDGGEIRAKVIEVLADLIKYKKFEHLNGPVYSLSKSRIFIISYENGEKEIFQADDPSQQETAPLPKHSFNFNPLGFVQFGPIVQLESRVAERLYLLTAFRYAYLGMAYHLAWDTGEGDQMDPSAFAVGVGLKGFSQPEGHTWYYGGIAEYWYTKVNWDVGESYETEEVATGVSLLGNIGYRWRKANGSHFNVGILAGMGRTISDEEYYVSSGELYGTYDVVVPLAMLELSFGWDLGKNR